MADDNEKGVGGRSQRRSKTPTWVGHVIKSAERSAEERVQAVKEASEDKEQFIREQLQREAQERDKRSQALYEIAKERADHQMVTIKRLWFVIVLLVSAVVVLAGHAVGLSIPGLGKVEMGGAKVENPADD